MVESKEFKIPECVILELDISSVPYFATTEEFPDILTRILVPPYEISLNKMDIVEIQEKMKNSKKKKEKNDKKILENAEISKIEKLKLQAENENGIEKKCKEKYFIKGKIQRINSDVICMNRVHEITDNFGNQKIDYEKQEISADIYTKVKEFQKIYSQLKAKEKQHKQNERRKNKLGLDEFSKDDLEKFKLVEEETIELQNIYQNILKEILRLEKDYSFNLKEILKIVDLGFTEQKFDKIKDISKTDMIKYMDLEKSLRVNINKTIQIVDEASALIKKQQKFAKIGAEANCRIFFIN